jgi:SAM-dependent methyltransferase
MTPEIGIYDDDWSAEIYDYQYPGAHDLPLWLSLAQEAGGPALELACGTGRLLLPMARAGVHITGLDLSPHMLAVCRRKLAVEPADVQARVRLLEASMADFSLDDRFGLVYIPARSFQALLARDDQRGCLEACRRHLRPGGRLAIDVFNTNLPRLTAPGGIEEEMDEFQGPGGATIRQYAHTDYDRANQTLLSIWRYESAPESGPTDVHEFALRLRYFFRFEMEWMLEACGFQVEALYGDRDRAPFAADSPEMILVARAAP